MKSSFSGNNGNCVDVQHDSTTEFGGHIREKLVEIFVVRDTKLGTLSPALSFNRAEWDAFIAGVKNGEFDFR